MMFSLRVISRLLDYPTEELWDNGDEMIAVLQDAEELPPTQMVKLVVFIRQLMQQDLLDAQANYSELFDRGRGRALLLFEHVHGDSRARGQAMVDLLDQYQQAGITLDSRELPDYLPTYLEYLTLLPNEQCIEELNDIAPILALLGQRLKQRGSEYAVLFDVLFALSGSSYEYSHLAEQVKNEPQDDTPAALDTVWEEEQVTFMAQNAAQCGSDMGQPHMGQESAVRYFNLKDLMSTGVQK